MRKLFFILLYCLFLSQYSLGQSDSAGSTNPVDSPQSKQSKGLSSDIYEKDPDEDKKSISAKVKLLREMGEIEVFFEGKDKGPYVLKEGPNLGLYKDRLMKSQKSKDQKANVKIEKDFIVSVELPEVKEKPKDSKSDVDSVLDSILKK
jgi:hypothetical protein